MSLRVLLADESPSIKKAFDLALKDFAVTVQTVHQGTDVLELYNSFKPDICFLDVLLPKKNGYDACVDIKQNIQNPTPVVLMWSNFMEVDEDKFNACKAEARIEKPFETKTLREIVLKYVHKTKNNIISEFLEPIDDKNSAQKTETSQGQNLEALGASAAAAVPALKDEVETDTPEPLSDNNLPDLPNIDDLVTSTQVEPEQSFEALADTEFSPSSEDNTSEDDDDFFGGLELSDTEENGSDDLENFQMEPLESFDAFENSDPEENNDSEDEAFGEFNFDPLPEPNSSTQVETNFESPSENSLTELSALEETPGDQAIGNQSFSEDMEDTDPSLLNDDLELPPPNLESAIAVSENSNTDLKSFDESEDETTEPSVVVAEAPIISPPPPPSFNAKEEVEAEVSEEAPSSSEKSFNLNSELTKEELKRLVMAQSKDIIESVVWEVVPELAKEMIKKEIERLTGELNPNEEIR